MPQPGPTPMQKQGSAAQMLSLAGAWPSRVPLPETKLEAEDAVLLGSTETGHRQRDCSHKGPDAVIYCFREERRARSDTRAKLSKQTPKDTE